MYNYTVADLFDFRNVVGNKLEQLLMEQKLPKGRVCTNAGISRPTLDKILAGKITSKANFEKHITKLLTCLDMTPNEMMGRIPNPFTSVQQLRNVLCLNLQELSQNTGIPMEELKKIEAGEHVPLHQLRDLAAYLGTGVRGLLGENYFQTTMSHMEDYLHNDKNTICSPGGFWGHFGILLKGHPHFMWFPVTAYTCSLVYKNQTQKYMVIPCMDNHLLLINTSHIQEMALLDEACDAPCNMDWDTAVSCGELPAVFYEAFCDYQSCCQRGGETDQDALSENFATAMAQIIQKLHLDLDAFADEMHTLTIYFSNGECRTHGLSLGEENTLAYTVTEIYEMGEPLDSEILRFQSDEEQDVFVNLRNVSMMKLPLEKVEAAIQHNRKELMNDT